MKRHANGQQNSWNKLTALNCPVYSMVFIVDRNGLFAADFYRINELAKNISG